MKTLLLSVSLFCSTLVLAQDFWSAAELEALGTSLESRVGANNAAIMNNIIRTDGYFAALVHREPGPGFSEVHAEWADVYFVTAGGASIVTGGTILDPRDTGPGEIQGSAIEGGTSRRIGAGDIVHIPAGIPHHVLVGEGETITYFILKAPRE